MKEAVNHILSKIRDELGKVWRLYSNTNSYSPTGAAKLSGH